MSGLLNLIRLKLGASITPANNFTLDASADNGTMRLYRGNAGTPIQDVLTVSAQNVVTAPAGAVLVGNGPIFSAGRAGNQGITSGVATKVVFDTEQFDTNNSYDPVLARFTPQVPGFYFVGLAVNLAANAGTLTTGYTEIRKNGLGVLFCSGLANMPAGNQVLSTGSAIVEMNGTTDYIECFATVTGTAPIVSGSGTRFFGHMVRSA